MFSAGSSSQATAPETPRWQRGLAAVSLVVANFVVVVPAVLLLILVWAVILAISGAQLMDAAGALKRSSFEPSLAGASLVTAVGGLGSVIVWSVTAIRRKRSGAAPVASQGVGRWVSKHPWMATGLLILVADVILVPLDRAGVDVPSALVGAALIGTGLWLLVTAAYGLFRGWALALGLVWAGVRRSSFFAGLVVFGSLAVSAGGILLGWGLSSAAQALSPGPPAEVFVACNASGAECSRRALVSAAQPKPKPPRLVIPSPSAQPPSADPQSAAAAPVVPGTEPSSQFSECINELHRQPSARDDGVRYAEVYLKGAGEAEDAVHATMLSVCNTSRPIREVRPYFFKSLMHAVSRQRKSYRRWCPMMPEPPSGTPDGCVARSVDEQVIHSELEHAAGAALCNLGATERWIIEARLWEDMSHDQIAAVLRISPENARQRYSRAVAALREEFFRRCR